MSEVFKFGYEKIVVGTKYCVSKENFVLRPTVIPNFSFLHFIYIYDIVEMKQ